MARNYSTDFFNYYLFCGIVDLSPFILCKYFCGAHVAHKTFPNNLNTL